MNTTVSQAAPLPRIDPESSVTRRFADVVARYADRVAIEDGDAHLSYAELDGRSGALAAALLDTAPGRSLRGEPVGLFLDQGAPFVTGLLGALKAGCLALPVDPRNPADRNRDVLHEAGAGVLVAGRERAEEARLLARGRLLLLVDTADRLDGPAPRVEPAPGDPATLLYTSGSTGRPKGVLQTHRTVLHNTRRHVDAFATSPWDRQTLFYPCGVYGGIRDILNTLLSGARLCRYALDTGGLGPLPEWLARHRITVYCSVATVFRQLARTLGERTFPEVRLVKLGGEAIFRGDFEIFRRHFPAARLSCGLASTEMGAVRQHFLDRGSTVASRRIPCGFPVDDMEVLILDADRRPVPVGEPGEIAVRSAYLSPGYWRRPDLTGAVFMPGRDGDPRPTYLSGDLGRLDPDGQLHHLGRKDDQVKVRGNRVELAEVEAALLELESVHAAAAVLRPDRRRGGRLEAFVVPAGGRAIDGAGVRRELADRLPAFMVPSRLHEVADLPLLPNGKVDRQVLLTRPEAADREPDAPAPAADPVEDGVLAVWRRVLDRNGIGPDDEFFTAGGDSLALLSLMVEVEASHGLRFPPEAIFDMSTPRRMAERIRDAETTAPAPDPGDRDTARDDGSGLDLIPIRRGGHLPPAVFVTPAGGSFLPYLVLASLLGDDQPFYAAQVTLPRRRNAAIDIAAAAEGLADRLGTRFPDGPLHIGGWSFGGFVAWELARRLRAAGRPVTGVSVVDTDMTLAGTRGSLRTLFKFSWMALQMFVHALPFVRDILHLRLTAAMRRSGSLRPLQRLLWRAGARNADVAPAVETNPHIVDLHRAPEALSRNMRACCRAIVRYEPRPADQAIDLYLCERDARGASGDRLIHAWRRLATAGVRVHRIRGNHFTLLQQPVIGELAARLRERMRDAPAEALAPRVAQ